MKIIIADAKTLKVNHYPLSGQKPLFEHKACELLNFLKQLDTTEIHDMMHISFKQSSLIYDYFHNDELYPALNLYDGVVLKQLHINKYRKEEFDYLNDYLLINSPLYGILRYNDMIHFHRLEITHKVNDISLYKYWKEEIKEYLKDEDYIISLSTKEYEKMIDHPHIIQIDFVQNVGGKLKRSAIYLKQARGKMLDYMIQHHISDIEEIKKIVVDEYYYNEEMSTSTKLVFIKNQQIQFIKK